MFAFITGIVASIIQQHSRGINTCGDGWFRSFDAMNLLKQPKKIFVVMISAFVKTKMI